MDPRKMMGNAHLVGGPKPTVHPEIPLVDMVGIQPVPDDGVAIIMLGSGGLFKIGCAMDANDCRRIGMQLLALGDTLRTPVSDETPAEGETHGGPDPQHP